MTFLQSYELSLDCRLRGFKWIFPHSQALNIIVKLAATGDMSVHLKGNFSSKQALNNNLEKSWTKDQSSQSH